MAHRGIHGVEGRGCRAGYRVEFTQFSSRFVVVVVRAPGAWICQNTFCTSEKESNEAESCGDADVRMRGLVMMRPPRFIVCRESSNTMLRTPLHDSSMAGRRVSVPKEYDL